VGSVVLGDDSYVSTEPGQSKGNEGPSRSDGEAGPESSKVEVGEDDSDGTGLLLVSTVGRTLYRIERGDEGERALRRRKGRLKLGRRNVGNTRGLFEVGDILAVKLPSSLKNTFLG
jgi:hypothetical protein